MSELTSKVLVEVGADVEVVDVDVDDGILTLFEELFLVHGQHQVYECITSPEKYVHLMKDRKRYSVM